MVCCLDVLTQHPFFLDLQTLISPRGKPLSKISYTSLGIPGGIKGIPGGIKGIPGGIKGITGGIKGIPGGIKGISGEIRESLEESGSHCILVRIIK